MMADEQPLQAQMSASSHRAFRRKAVQPNARQAGIRLQVR